VALPGSSKTGDIPQLNKIRQDSEELSHEKSQCA
jgi:hypothetical protein